MILVALGWKIAIYILIFIAGAVGGIFLSIKVAIGIKEMCDKAEADSRINRYH